MADCVPDTRYVATPDFMATTLHCFTFVEVPVLIFGAYCILFKTPLQMRSVKWLMLNLHLWSALSDLMLSFFGIPYVLLPALAGYGLGVFNAPGLLIYCCITLIAGLTASVMAIYENRFYCLFGRNTWWKDVRKPFFVLVFSLVPICFLPPYLNIPEQESAREIVVQSLPCLPPYTFDNREMFVLSLSYDIPVYCVATSTVFLATSIIIFFLLTFYHMWSQAVRSNVSARTLNMQKKFAVSLTLQSAFMLLVVLAPVMTCLVIIATWHFDQALNNFLFLVLSFHGVGSTIVMVVVHKPYRDFTLSKLYVSSGDSGQHPFMRNVSPSVII